MMHTLLARSADIFAQLAHASPAEGHPVRPLIETHDAWLHAPSAQLSITPDLCRLIENMPRPATLQARIRRQRQSLAPLVVHLRPQPAATH
ncbi:MAG TPA: hypothetical protein VH253_19690 [Phycisphaerae bacterium]|nr:hypothetical protein [Phycisphaerae bacterium]